MDWEHSFSWEGPDKTPVEIAVTYRALTVGETLRLCDMATEQVEARHGVARQRAKMLQMVVETVKIGGEKRGVDDLPADCWEEIYGNLPSFR